MSDIRLPQRPMVELPPPVDGLQFVQREAGRRRRRRAGVAAASLTTAAGIAVVVALAATSGGVAVLEPAPPAGPGLSQPTPAASGPVTVQVGPAGRHHQAGDGRQTVVVVKPRGAPGPGAGRSVTGAPAATDATPPVNGQGSRAQQPQLVRWQSAYTGAPRECSGSTYGGPDNTFENSVGWCLDVMAAPVSDGVRLHIQLCRDATGGGTLSFAGSREVDLAVLQGNRTVWDWAALHPGGSGAHQISANANGCWNWSLVWSDLAQDGGTAGHGSFTFVGTSTAQEMKGKPDESTTFSY